MMHNTSPEGESIMVRNLFWLLLFCIVLLSNGNAGKRGLKTRLAGLLDDDSSEHNEEYSRKQRVAGSIVAVVPSSSSSSCLVLPEAY